MKGEDESKVEEEEEEGVEPKEDRKSEDMTSLVPFSVTENSRQMLMAALLEYLCSLYLSDPEQSRKLFRGQYWCLLPKFMYLNLQLLMVICRGVLWKESNFTPLYGMHWVHDFTSTLSCVMYHDTVK